MCGAIIRRLPSNGLGRKGDKKTDETKEGMPQRCERWLPCLCARSSCCAKIGCQLFQPARKGLLICAIVCNIVALASIIFAVSSLTKQESVAVDTAWSRALALPVPMLVGNCDALTSQQQQQETTKAVKPGSLEFLTGLSGVVFRVEMDGKLVQDTFKLWENINCNNRFAFCDADKTDRCDQWVFNTTMNYCHQCEKSVSGSVSTIIIAILPCLLGIRSSFTRSDLALDCTFHKVSSLLGGIISTFLLLFCILKFVYGCVENMPRSAQVVVWVAACNQQAFTVDVDFKFSLWNGSILVLVAVVAKFVATIIHIIVPIPPLPEDAGNTAAATPEEQQELTGKAKV